MKAVRVHTPGGPDALTFEDVPEPVAKAGEAVIRIDAAGLNYIDVYVRSGLYKNELPFTAGFEAGGTVAGAGPDVTDVKVGDRVAYTGVLGAYAQFADDVILYTRQDFVAEVKRLTDGKGVQV